MKQYELKFLVDVGVGRKVEKHLQRHGYDAKCVRAIDPRIAGSGNYSYSLFRE